MGGRLCPQRATYPLVPGSSRDQKRAPPDMAGKARAPARLEPHLPPAQPRLNLVFRQSLRPTASELAGEAQGEAQIASQRMNLTPG
jgi:hypothetical protein